MKRLACIALIIAACAAPPPSQEDDDTPPGPGPTGDTGDAGDPAAQPGAFTLTGPSGEILTADATAVVTLSWTAAERATGYAWKVSRDAACADVVQEGSSAALSAPTPDALNPGEYYACATATNGSGATPASNNGLGFSVRRERPAPFSITARAHQRRGTASLSWTASAGAVGYDVTLARDADCADAVFTSSGVTATSVPVPRSDERIGALFACVTAVAQSGETLSAMNDGLLVYLGAFVLGQPDVFTTSEQSHLGVPSGVLRIGNRLFIANQNEHAVEVYDAEATYPARRPLFSLGQPGFMNHERNDMTARPPAANTLNEPKGLASDGTRLAVADSANHRVLIWNTIPTTFAEPADVVLGQADLESVSAGPLTAASLGFPESVAFIGSGGAAKLVVADRGPNRILIWNTVPTSNNADADVVLGQPDFGNAASGCSASTLSAPTDVASDGTRLAVADTQNNRVLIWNTIPTTSGTAADAVIGQPDAVTCTQAGTSAQTVLAPRGVAFAEDGALWVADHDHERVLRFDPAPDFSNGQAAAVALGQTDLTAAVAGAERAQLDSPTRLSVFGDDLYIADTGNGRVVRYAAASAATGAAALDLVGKFAFAGEPTDELNYPGAVASNGAQLVIAGYSNNTLSVYDGRPTAAGPSPTRVYGSPYGASATELAGPWDATFCGDKVVVADYDNDRLTVLDPNATDLAVLRVFGQPDLTSDVSLTPPTASSIRGPYGLACAGSRLILADNNNNRVLIWNAPFDKPDSDPDFNGTPADIVLGQPDMTTAMSGTAMTALNGPTAVAVDGDRLFVLDSNNHRVLVFNGFAALTSADNGRAADVVIGYAPADGVPVNDPPVNAAQFVNAYGLAASDGRLWVSNSNAARVLEFSAIPMTQAPTDAAIAATAVIGQANFTDSAPWAGGTPDDEVFNTPESLAVDEAYLYISDSGDDRVVMLPRD